MGETPYHYGSHYSTIGGVLHFLARLEPFSRYLIEFQGGKFDVRLDLSDELSYYLILS